MAKITASVHYEDQCPMCMGYEECDCGVMLSITRVVETWDFSDSDDVSYDIYRIGDRVVALKELEARDYDLRYLRQDLEDAVAAYYGFTTQEYREAMKRLAYAEYQEYFPASNSAFCKSFA